MFQHLLNLVLGKVKKFEGPSYHCSWAIAKMLRGGLWGPPSLGHRVNDLTSRGINLLFQRIICGPPHNQLVNYCFLFKEHSYGGQKLGTNTNKKMSKNSKMCFVKIFKATARRAEFIKISKVAVCSYLSESFLNNSHLWLGQSRYQNAHNKWTIMIIHIQLM